MFLAEIAVPTNPQDALEVARKASEYGDRVLFLIAIAIIIISCGWVIMRLFAKLDAKEAQVEAITGKMITVMENNNSVLEDIKDLMDKIKSKSGALVLILLPLFFVGCGTGMQGGYKGWKWQPATSVLQSEKLYAPGTNGQTTLIAERTYYVQPATNAPTRWYVRNRAYTIADGKNNLTKVKTLLTDKTITSGLDALDQESKGDVIPATVEKVGTAVPNILKSAAGVP